MSIRPIKQSIRLSRYAACLTGILMLTGCASMNSSFDCPVKSKGGCQPLDQVNAMVNQGAFDEGAQVATVASNKASQKGNGNGYHLWVAPYKDISGNVHLGAEVLLQDQAVHKAHSGKGDIV